MNPQDLDRAISCAAHQINVLLATLAAAGPVEAIILMPIISQAHNILNTLQQLKSALREVQS
jgi:hypothetical protein